jgi:hypothetical protein
MRRSSWTPLGLGNHRPFTTGSSWSNPKSTVLQSRTGPTALGTDGAVEVEALEDDGADVSTDGTPAGGVSGDESEGGETPGSSRVGEASIESADRFDGASSGGGVGEEVMMGILQSRREQ